MSRKIGVDLNVDREVSGPTVSRLQGPSAGEVAADEIVADWKQPGPFARTQFGCEHPPIAPTVEQGPESVVQFVHSLERLGAASFAVFEISDWQRGIQAMELPYHSGARAAWVQQQPALPRIKIHAECRDRVQV